MAPFGFRPARLVRFVSLPITAVLVIFSLRRILFTVTALFRPRQDGLLPPADGQPNTLPDVLVLVPCRDEADVVGELCQALDQIDYPQEKLRVVLIDDGSVDSTRTLMNRFAQDRPNWNVLGLPVNGGKPAALNAALARCPFGEIVYVFDSDHRPEPSVLRRAVRYFADPRVAGVSGRSLPSNPLASPAAYYSTVENYVHQMVTMRAKDRLGLAPALLGSNCGYRRATLAECGGFTQGALLEDSDLTVTFHRAGHRVRFAEDAMSYHQVPQSVDGYLKQHRRWARGFNDVARNHAASLMRGARLSLPLRVELILFSTGYLDRAALAGATVLTVLSYVNRRRFPFPRGVLYFALLTPMAQIVVLFAQQRASRAYWLRLPLIPFFLVLDILAALRAMVDSLLNRPQVWTKTERSRDASRQMEISSWGR